MRMSAKASDPLARRLEAAGIARIDKAPALGAPALAGRIEPAQRKPGVNEILLGRDTGGLDTYLDMARLLEGRLLVQGVSQAGKSWTLRRILEQTVKMLPQAVLDPEGEFSSIAEEFGHLLINADQLDEAGFAELGRRVRQHRLSVVIDLSEIKRADQMLRASAFIDALIECPKEWWQPLMVAIDEAHILAPHGASTEVHASVRKAAVSSVTDLNSRGRKRGLVAVTATQRIARLAKSVASEASNFLIGQNTLDIDIKRAADLIGWEASKAFDRLPVLEPGHFVTVGRAFSNSASVVHVGEIITRHIGATPALARGHNIDRVRAEQLAGIETLTRLKEQGEADADIHVGAGFKAVRKFLRSPDSRLAGAVIALLEPLAPQGAATADIARELGASTADIGDCCSLLESYDIVETSVVKGKAAARLTKSFLAIARS